MAIGQGSLEISCLSVKEAICPKDFWGADPQFFGTYIV